MKKIFLALVCILCTLTVSAQYAGESASFFSAQRSEQPVTWGIRGGVNFSKMTMSSDGYSLSPSNNIGYNVGICVDIPMLESLYLQSGLYWTVKGYKMEDGGEKVTATPSYLEIPILASYRYYFSDYTHLQINFGPYFAYGVAGKYKWEYDGEKADEDFFGDGIKRFDAGFAMGAGMTFGHIFVGFNYDLGLANLLEDSDGVSWKNRTFSINLEYNF